MILRIIVRFALFLVFIQMQITSGAIPPDISLCRSEDVECISKVTTDILRNNPNGRHELGIPRLEPLRIKSIIINEGNQGPLALNLALKDIDLTGFSEATVERTVGFSTDPKTSKFEMYALFPKISLKGIYRASGRILVLPIQGEGECNISLEGVKASVRFKPSLKIKNYKTYLEVKHLKVLLEPKTMKIHLENLFNGDRALGENMNKFLNDNWNDLWAELGPSINVAIADILKNLMTNVFKTFAYEEIYRTDYKKI